jgi:hypothetical protein
MKPPTYITFRELKVGDTFRFKSAHNHDEIRRKVSWDKYVDVHNGEWPNGTSVDPNWIKKVGSRESKVYPKPNWTIESHNKERRERIKKHHQTIRKTCGKV